MPRAIKVLEPGDSRGRVIDTLILNSEQRRAPHGVVRGGKGMWIELDFVAPVTLRTDDLLLLDDGDVVEVVAAAEPLIEVRADLSTLARIAWALGDRHVPVQILPNRIRLHSDDALQALIIALGGKAAAIEAPFEPEGGAYSIAHATHDHQRGNHQHHEHHQHAHGHHHAHDDHEKTRE